MTKTRLAFTILALAGASLFVTPASAIAQKKKQRDIVTREEIEKSAQSALDLFTAVRSLRPHFLEPARGIRTLGNGTVPPTAVYVDGRRETGLDALRSLPAMAAQEIRYLDPTKAAGEYGESAAGGAVVVKLYREPKGPAAPRDTMPGDRPVPGAR
jgi:hypothetical protein